MRFLLPLLLLTSTAQAQTTVNNYYKTLYDAAAVTADVTLGNATAVCFDRPQAVLNPYFVLVGTFNSGTGTADVSVYESSDGDNWVLIDTFTQVGTASDSSKLIPTVSVGRCFKVVVDVSASGSPNYDLNVRAYFQTK